MFCIFLVFVSFLQPFDFWFIFFTLISFFSKYFSSVFVFLEGIYIITSFSRVTQFNFCSLFLFVFLYFLFVFAFLPTVSIFVFGFNYFML